MRIAIDVSPLSHPRTGIGNYLSTLVAAMAAADPKPDIVAFAPTRPRGRRYILDGLNGLDVERRLLRVPCSHRIRQAWSRFGWPPAESVLGKFDVMHFSDWMYPPQRQGLRATTIYDLVPLHFPAWTTARTRGMHSRKYEAAREQCGMIVAISDYTAADIEDTLQIEPDRLVVAYPAVHPRYSLASPPAQLKTPYILAVSTLEPRKGLRELLRAYAVLRSRDTTAQLVIAGAAGWGEKVEFEQEGVHRIGYVSDDDLASLYRSASVMVYPSSFEGFGLPVVEAMASGTPVVTSEHPSIDEASGTAAYRCDPADPEALAETINLALTAGPDRVQAGLQHAARFTPEACASAVLAGYRARV
jgi:glycosyltransferase involved in cell wall biosynthesis